MLHKIIRKAIMAIMLKLFFPAGDVIRDNKSWLFMAAGIFFCGVLLLALAPPVFGQVGGESVQLPFEELEGMLSLILEAAFPINAILIFLNNFLSMAQMLLLGVVAGISPLFTLGLNGALVGMIMAASAAEGLPVGAIVVLGILPHGFFELFAFFLCGAMGLKFGYHLFFPLAGKNRLASYRYIWKEAISLLPLVVILLAAAAVIEVLITPRLLALVL